MDNLPPISASDLQSPSFGERIDFILAFLRRRYLPILICGFLSVPAALLYLYTTPPTYTATTTMMIELQKSPFDSLMGNAPANSAWIESQIGVLRSQNVAAYVVKQLRLADDPKFIRPEPGLFDKVLARFGLEPSQPTSEAERTGAALAAVMGGLDVKRIANSYVMRIDYSAQNSDVAVKVANGVIDAYIFDQLNAKYQANRRAGDWLQERLQTLREQAAAAERAVLEFKAKNNIVSAQGTLMSDKQLSEGSSQLAMARAKTADVQIRLERINAVREAYQTDQPVAGADENVTEAMNNAIIGRLRGQYLDLKNRESDWSLRYGKNHTAVVNLRNQIRDIRRSIRDELGRIEETTKSEYEIAKKQQDELEKGLAGLVSQSATTNQAQVTLFSLEAAAQSYRKLYDNFLQRHTQNVQQQSWPVSDARSLSQAGVRKTSPQALKVWLVTIFAGGMLGAGIGAYREVMDRKFRTREQVRSVLATECLALVPLMIEDRKRLSSRRRSPAAIPYVDQIAPRSICFSPKIMQTIIDEPSSPYADAIQSIKLTVDQNTASKHTKIIGLTSCLASEGKSTLAAAMAALIARGGDRAILLDCDLRHPSLSRALAPDANAGFFEVAAGKIELADAVWTDQSTGMAFLPAGASSGMPNAAEILASDDAKSIFDVLQIKYDYVIVDLPPLAAGVDVRATSGLINSYVMVVEWGATKIEAVQYALRNAPDVQASLAGVVLNKVNLAAMSRYDSHGANYYYGQPRSTNSVQ